MLDCIGLVVLISLSRYFLYRQGNCRRVNSGMDCEIGLRRRTYHTLCGSVLNIWARVEDVLASGPHHSSKIQVVRLKTQDGVKLVGKSCTYINYYLRILTTAFFQQ